jgi:hypothetical protein
MKHLLMKVWLPQAPLLDPQHNPKPLGVVPGGQFPLAVGVVQLPPTVVPGRLQVCLCIDWPFQRLPPVIVIETPEPEKLALNSQFGKVHFDVAIPCAAKQVTADPRGPVPLSARSSKRFR